MPQGVGRKVGAFILGALFGKSDNARDHRIIWRSKID